ncbi:MAG: serine protein kinase RIO [Candidatus Micrarchaeota archaeon]|nr:serine protein kinase RIO [Candidatus Micrarchaeota archaeon]
MARKWSKRKRPDRDKHMIMEVSQRKGGIFNERTMRFLSKFYNKGIVERVAFIISTGKEADVYAAESGSSEAVKSDLVALKFFRGEGISFNKMREYIEGDPRFGNLRSSRTSIVEIWCRKEFGNLVLAGEAGASVPKPYMFNGNILAMEFIGDENDAPSKRMKDVVLDDPKKVLKSIIDQIKRMYRAGLVHADLSEFNILIQGEKQKPVIIDIGQGVVIRHPRAKEFLERDVHNIARYFSQKYGIESNEKDILDGLTRPSLS